MREFAMHVEGLGKRYRIGQQAPYQTLREAVAKALQRPLRRQPQTDQLLWALKDVFFEVHRGEVVGIIGANGAGKSTLLKILSRITEPTEGFAEVRGRIGSLLEVGTGFHPELTGRENVYLNGAILGMRRSEIADKFDDIVAFAGVERFVDTPVKHYSSGMYVRLAFAVAAHLETEVLLVDEVLAVGDAAFQLKCLNKMSEVSGSGRTILFVSHNLEAVSRLCQRVVWFENGCVHLDGQPDHVVSAYLAKIRGWQDASARGSSLDGHPGRLKSFDGLVRLTSCRVRGSLEDADGAIASGRSCRVLLGFQAAAPLQARQVNFVVVFKVGQSQRVASCWSELGREQSDLLGAEGVVECRIPRLPLVPGQYTLDIGCKVASAWSDMIYDAALVEVVTGPFYASGQLLPSGMGPCLIDYEWRVGEEIRDGRLVH